MTKKMIKRIVAAATLVVITTGSVLLPSPAQAKDTWWPPGVSSTNDS